MLEHTKPLYNENNLLTLQNLYTFHTLNGIFKILKYHSPISMFNLIVLNSASIHLTVLPPKINLDIFKYNFVLKACSLWNASVSKLFSKSIAEPNTDIIIPGSQINSDLTCTIAAYKSRLTNFLLSLQKAGDVDEWSDSNFFNILLSKIK